MKSYSLKRISKELNISVQEAKWIKDIIESFELGEYNQLGHWSHAVSECMGDISRAGGFYGEESLYPDIPDIFYCNAGDTYTNTVVYDNRRKHPFFIATIGDVIERES